MTLDNIKSNDSYKFDALVQLINQPIELIRFQRMFTLRLGSPWGWRLISTRRKGVLRIKEEEDLQIAGLAIARQPFTRPIELTDRYSPS